MGLQKNRIVDIRFAGVQRLYKVTLENGEGTYIKCTENHKFPTPYGIKELSELSVGDELYWMSNEMIYQIKIDRIAPQALRKKIISIEDFGEAPTYDVEMAEPDHNFATETGIITSNSHSYCVSLDSLYGAWLKAHHPVEFYEVFINQMEEKGDKDRAQDAKREAEEYFGIKFLPYRYGQDNRAPIADVEKRIITKSLTSVKGFGKTLARELYQCSKNDFKYFVDVLKWLDERSIKEAKVTPLIQIDYFQQFGNSAELSRIMRMFDFFKQGTMKTIRKEKLAGSELEHIVARHATDRNVKNEELKTYTITDITAILHECEDYIKSLNISEINLKVKMQNQLDILGYIDIKTGVPEDRRKLIVTDLVPLKSKTSGDVWGYRDNKSSFASMLDRVYNKKLSLSFVGDRSNANADSALVTTQKAIVYNELNSELYKKFFLTSEERQAMNEGYIYIHDRGSRLDSVNCCLFDMGAVLKGGFFMGNLDYQEPKTLDVAFDLVGDIAMNAASCQYGGFTISEIDKLLAPYAEMSFKKYYNEYVSLTHKDGKAAEN